MPTPQELRDEERRVRHIVGVASAMIIQGQLAREDAEEIVATARARILELFPGQEQTYEVLYARRFARLIDAFTEREGRHRLSNVVPFRPGH